MAGVAEKARAFPTKAVRTCVLPVDAGVIRALLKAAAPDAARDTRPRDDGTEEVATRLVTARHAPRNIGLSDAVWGREPE